PPRRARGRRRTRDRPPGPRARTGAAVRRPGAAGSGRTRPRRSPRPGTGARRAPGRPRRTPRWRARSTPPGPCRRWPDRPAPPGPRNRRPARRGTPPRDGASPEQVVEGLGGHAPVPLVAGDLPGPEVQPGQLRVVVQHLLEVGNVPPAVDGVAVEPPADLVV